jgi:hypothetical protein
MEPSKAMDKMEDVLSVFIPPDIMLCVEVLMMLHHTNLKHQSSKGPKAHPQFLPKRNPRVLTLSGAVSQTQMTF